MSVSSTVPIAHSKRPTSQPPKSVPTTTAVTPSSTPTIGRKAEQKPVTFSPKSQNSDLTTTGRCAASNIKKGRTPAVKIEASGTEQLLSTDIVPATHSASATRCKISCDASMRSIMPKSNPVPVPASKSS